MVNIAVVIVQKYMETYLNKAFILYCCHKYTSFFGFSSSRRSLKRLFDLIPIIHGKMSIYEVFSEFCRTRVICF